MADTYTDTYFDLYGQVTPTVEDDAVYDDVYGDIYGEPPETPPPPPPIVWEDEPLPPPAKVRVRHWAPFDAAGTYTARDVDAWTSLDLEPRYNQPGTWRLVVPHNEQSARIGKTHMVTFDFRDFRMTGVIEKRKVYTDDQGKPMLELSGAEALSLLGDTVCWPSPTQPIGQQTAVRWRATGEAETVLGDLIRANVVTRRRDFLDIPASQGRGSVVTINVRFRNLLTVVVNKCNAAGLGVRVGLVESGSSTKARMRLEFFEPADRSRRFILSHKLGTLRSWAAEDVVPTGTQVIAMGSGKGMARKYRRVTDLAAEAEWGRRREVTTDARDEDDLAVLVERATETLSEVSAQSAFELDTAEAQGMRMFVHANLGDLVTVEPIPGLTRVERVNAVRIVANPAVSVQVVPGNPDATTPMFGQAALIRELRRRQSALEQEED